MERLLCVVIGYLFGLIQTGYIYGKIKNIDIRKHGSGNAGTTNALRTLGWKAGVITFIGDCLKCVVAVTLVQFLFIQDLHQGLYAMYAGLGAVLGHNFPFYLKFKGGKGIATTCGVFMVGLISQSPWFWLIIPIAYISTLAFIYFVEYASLASLIIVSAFGITGFILFSVEYAGVVTGWLVGLYAFVFLICAIDWFAHRANIKRLLAGEEHKTSLKSMLKKKKK